MLNAVTIAAIVAACWAHPQGQAYLAKIETYLSKVEAISAAAERCGNPCCHRGLVTNEQRGSLVLSSMLAHLGGGGQLADLSSADNPTSVVNSGASGFLTGVSQYGEVSAHDLQTSLSGSTQPAPLANDDRRAGLLRSTKGTPLH